MRIIIVGGMLFFTASCSHEPLRIHDGLTKDKFNDFASDRKGTLFVKNQKTFFTGRKYRIHGEEIVWVDDSTSITKSVKISEVHRVLFKERGKGANYGAGIGAGTCAALVVVAAVEALAAPDDGNSKKQPISSQILVTSYFIFGGAAAGALIGFIKGYETSFIFDQ